MRAHPPAECADPSSCPQHSESWHTHHGCTCLWAGDAEPAHVSPDCPAPHHVAMRHDGQPDGRTTAEWIADLVKARQDAEARAQRAEEAAAACPYGVAHHSCCDCAEEIVRRMRALADDLDKATGFRGAATAIRRTIESVIEE